MVPFVLLLMTFDLFLVSYLVKQIPNFIVKVNKNEHVFGEKHVIKHIALIPYSVYDVCAEFGGNL